MRLLYLRPEADDDLENGRQWYEKRSAGLGQEFLDEVQFYFQRIAQFPESFSRCHPKVHRVTLRRFPFVVYYRFDSVAIEVLAVLHGKRSALWKHRISNN